MNSYDELALRDEVVYLHSLWHQGPPPPQAPNPIIHLPPSSFSQPLLRPHFHPHHTLRPFVPSHTRSLPPVVASTSFKKKNRKKKKKNKRNNSPGPEWPCPASPGPPVTGWPEPKPRSDPPPELSPQEKERLSSLKSQNKACQAFKDFLIGSDDDDFYDSDDHDEDEDDGLKDFEEFFIRVFMEDNELRRYYQQCFENGGEFCCFVCGAVEKKKSLKKFKDCLGLVNHSMSILRTGSKRAHRGFGHAVCKVLGWDVHRLPTIVMKGEPLGCSAEPQRKPPRTKQNMPAQEGGTSSSVAQEESVVDNPQNGGTTANSTVTDATAVNYAAQAEATATASSIEPSIVSSGAQEEGGNATQGKLATQYSQVAAPEQDGETSSFVAQEESVVDNPQNGGTAANSIATEAAAVNYAAQEAAVVNYAAQEAAIATASSIEPSIISSGAQEAGGTASQATLAMQCSQVAASEQKMPPKTKQSMPAQEGGSSSSVAQEESVVDNPQNGGTTTNCTATEAAAVNFAAQEAATATANFIEIEPSIVSSGAQEEGGTATQATLASQCSQVAAPEQKKGQKRHAKVETLGLNKKRSNERLRTLKVKEIKGPEAEAVNYAAQEEATANASSIEPSIVSSGAQEEGGTATQATLTTQCSQIAAPEQKKRNPPRTKQSMPAEEGGTSSSVAQEETVVDNPQNGGTTANSTLTEAAAVNYAAQEAATATACSIEPSIVSSGAQEEGGTATQATLATQCFQVAAPEQEKGQNRHAKVKTLGLNKKRSSERLMLRTLKAKEIKVPEAEAVNYAAQEAATATASSIEPSIVSSGSQEEEGTATQATLATKCSQVAAPEQKKKKPPRTKQSMSAEEGGTSSSVAQEETVVDNPQNGGTTTNSTATEAAAVDYAAQEAATATASSIEPSIVSSGAQEEGGTATQATLATQCSQVAAPEQKKGQKRHAKVETLGLNKKRSSERLKLRTLKAKDIKGPGATAIEPLVIDQVEVPDDPSLGILPTWGLFKNLDI